LKSRRRASSPKSLKAQQFAAPADAEMDLLIELAAVLLDVGITPHRLNSMMTQAFARAAAHGARLKNGRVSYSRVAAKTGLRRAAVTALLEKGRPPLVALTPVDTVVNGWRADSDFLDHAGKPIQLKLAGKRNAFARLAQRYARDIPQRALVQELIAEGVVSCTANGLRLRSARRKTTFLASDSFFVSIGKLLNKARRQRAGRRSKKKQRN
jgi:hypothetical protein